MKKKNFIFVFCFLIAALVVFCLKSYSISNKQFSENRINCPFCNKKILDYQKYFESENVIGLYNYKPIIKGHCLIVPKRHVQKLEELNSLELEEIFDLIKKTHVSAQKVFDVKSYLVLEKNGKEVGQTVPHLHFHYIPNKEEGSNISFLFKFILGPFNRKINEKQMREVTLLISQNI